MLVLVRAAVLFGAGVWLALAPIGADVRAHCGVLLGVFLLYSALIALLVTCRPGRARSIYLGALAADLAFLYFLLGATGGIDSPFLPAAFLLGALTAFHYGPVLGVLAAWTALGLAVASDAARLADRHWSALPLLFIFAAVAAAYLGWLAQREAEERRLIARLNDELRARARDLEAAYQRCQEVQGHLLDAERLATIGRMSAEMAHQVRNPLSSISLNLELLEDEVCRLPGVSAAETARLFAAIHREVDNLAEVTESYLRFAKLPPFRWESADLNEVIRELVVFAQPQVEQRAVRLSQRLAPCLPPVRLDRRQFKFALMGLLTNALEAMAAGGRLRIRTQANGHGVEVHISDTGVGIPPEHLERIFEPFFTTKPGGTGLGLSLARRIIEAHGGRIYCESIRQVGTTFTVVLPCDGSGGAHG